MNIPYDKGITQEYLMTKKEIRELLLEFYYEYREDEKIKEMLTKLVLRVVNFKRK